MGGWYVASAATARNVTVETALTWCRDTPLRTERVTDDGAAPTRIEVTAVTPRTRCRVHVSIRNHGPPVRLDRGVAPGLGPAGSARDDGCTACRTTVTAWTRLELSSSGRDVAVTSERDLSFRWRTGHNPGCVES